MSADYRKGKSLFATTANSFGTGEGVTITPNDVSGLPTGNLVLTFDREVTGKVERIKGAISGSNFVVASGGRGYDGTTETSHTSPNVEYIYNGADQNDAVDAFIAEHSVAGVHDATKVVTPTGTQTLTNKTLTSPVINTPTGDVATLTGTQTLTNKRITARVQSVSDAATVTPNADSDDCVDITAIAQAFTIANPSGTPTNFQKLTIRIKDNATARAITWGSGYAAGGVSLPSTTVLSKILNLGFIYNTANSLNKWQLVASAQEA